MCISIATPMQSVIRFLKFAGWTHVWSKRMTGLLASEGLRVSQLRVGEALRRINPQYHHARRTATAKKMNPVPYHADYFGYKLHIDQNEKLVMFGVTHICAIDGYSGKIVGFITMPVKTIWRFMQIFFGEKNANVQDCND